jgi:hypothetical protein
MIAPPTPAAVPMAVLHASKEYLACTPKQRVWVDTFMACQDAVQATRAAYPSAKYSQAFAAQLRANFHIRAALNAALGLSEYEMFLDEVQREIHHAPTGSDRKIRALAMYARMKWGDKGDESTKPTTITPIPKPQTEPTPPERKVFFVGQRVTSRRKDGSFRFGIVTEIDSDGRPTKFEDAPE